MNIAIIGGQCAGKTTAAEALPDYFTVVKFAEPLYAINEVLGVDKIRGHMQDESDVIKKHFGEEFFALRFLEKYKHYDNLVCDDVRYMLEFVMLKALGWKTVYIDADKDTRHSRARHLGLAFLENHSSESNITHIGELCEVIITNGEYTTKEAFEHKIKFTFQELR